MKTALQLAALAALSSSLTILGVHAQNGTVPPTAAAAPTVAPGETDPWATWYWTGAQSVIWVSAFSCFIRRILLSPSLCTRVARRTAFLEFGLCLAASATR